MDGLVNLLNQKLKGFERLAILGVGSDLRADDGAGDMVAKRMAIAFPSEKYPNLLCCAGGTAPENFSGKIERFRPTHLLAVDAADTGLIPGEISDIDPDTVGGPGFCSHLLPLKVMLDYLTDQTGCSVSLIGIQPKTLEFDGAMSDAVISAVDILCEAISEIILSK